MARDLLTAKTVANAKPNVKDRVLSDGAGLQLRILPSGTKIFELRYRVYGKASKITIGTYPDKDLKSAREKAGIYRDLVSDGIDPRQWEREEEAKKRAESLEKTVQDLFDDWMGSYVITHRKRPDQVDEFLQKDVIPFIGKIRAKDIERRHVVEIVDRIVQRGAIVKADKVLSLIKQMFSHGAAKGFMDRHPCPDLQRKHFGIKPKSNQRFLSEKEIIELFEKLPESGLPERTRYAIVILLATAQRTGELRQARWSSIDFKNKIWIVPPEYSKNGKAHIVHLSEFALRYFEKLKELSINDLVLGSYRKPDQPIDDKTLTKQIRDRQRETPLKNRTTSNGQSLILKNGPWSLHCLRHSAHTGMGGLGVPPYIVEKILNHTMPGIMGVYNHQPYYAERESALNLWGNHLDRLCNAKMSNVVYIRSK